MYHQITEEDQKFLMTVFPAERLFFGEEIREDYSHDELGGISHFPEALVKAH